MIDIGNIEIQDLFVGSANAVGLYQGAVAIWEKSEPQPAGPWLCFTANTANSTIHLDKVGTPNAISLETSTDGTTWTDYRWTDTTGDTLTLTNIGDKVYMRAKTENSTIGSSNSNYYKFVGTGSFAASGNIQSLLKADCSRVDAPGSCYLSMFQGCSSLTTAPELPATTLANACYEAMFRDCTSLTSAPALSATTLVTYCYNNMFNGCSSLTTAPALPATTLVNYCYWGMFQGCTSLTTAPELPATTLANGCYRDMFKGCSNLSSITLGYTGNFAFANFNGWVSGVASSGTFYYNGSDTTRGPDAIPRGWTVTPYTP